LPELLSADILISDKKTYEIIGINWEQIRWGFYQELLSQKIIKTISIENITTLKECLNFLKINGSSKEKEEEEKYELLSEIEKKKVQEEKNKTKTRKEILSQAEKILERDIGKERTVSKAQELFGQLASIKEEYPKYYEPLLKLMRDCVDKYIEIKDIDTLNFMRLIDLMPTDKDSIINTIFTQLDDNGRNFLAQSLKNHTFSLDTKNLLGKYKDRLTPETIYAIFTQVDKDKKNVLTLSLEHGRFIELLELINQYADKRTKNTIRSQINDKAADILKLLFKKNDTYPEEPPINEIKGLLKFMANNSENSHITKDGVKKLLTSLYQPRNVFYNKLNILTLWFETNWVGDNKAERMAQQIDFIKTLVAFMNRFTKQVDKSIVSEMLAQTDDGKTILELLLEYNCFDDLESLVELMGKYEGLDNAKQFNIKTRGKELLLSLLKKKQFNLVKTLLPRIYFPPDRVIYFPPDKDTIRWESKLIHCLPVLLLPTIIDYNYWDKKGNEEVEEAADAVKNALDFLKQTETLTDDNIYTILNQKNILDRLLFGRVSKRNQTEREINRSLSQLLYGRRKRSFNAIQALLQIPCHYREKLTEKTIRKVFAQLNSNRVNILAFLLKKAPTDDALTAENTAKALVEFMQHHTKHLTEDIVWDILLTGTKRTQNNSLVLALNTKNGIIIDGLLDCMDQHLGVAAVHTVLVNTAHADISTLESLGDHVDDLSDKAKESLCKLLPQTSGHLWWKRNALTVLAKSIKNDNTLKKVCQLYVKVLHKNSGELERAIKLSGNVYQAAWVKALAAQCKKYFEQETLSEDNCRFLLLALKTMGRKEFKALLLSNENDGTVCTRLVESSLFKFSFGKIFIWRYLKGIERKLKDNLKIAASSLKSSESALNLSETEVNKNVTIGQGSQGTPQKTSAQKTNKSGFEQKHG